jgi:PIN domain nuclease of toxin-antitoxin system
MAIKMKIGKLDLDLKFKEFANYLSNYNIEILPIAFEHVLETMNLEDHHRDPFDRIIIAQAKHESWIIISKDENFPRYAQFKLI